ncbi:unnamed protein product [Symbiodinium natans]|uniref:Uncharacterized protein n=1 Tax=Symbiodinium natans TaxID=878477 RepID=A0A812PBS3_9DINO|nr:unnamed protein product [Symbiodinium natans]
MRIIQRVWRTDDRLTEIMETLVTSGSAFLKHLNHSPELQSLFQANLKKQKHVSNTGTSHSLSYAAHRFDSQVKPLAHFLLSFEAALATAMQVQSLRAGDDYGKDAAGAENILQTALMVDAGDMVMCLLRFFDRATFDVALMGEQLHLFCQKLDWAFNKKHILELEDSFTGHALRLLAKTHIVRIPGQKWGSGPLTVGGPGFVAAATRQRCLARMQAFVVLAVQTVRAEFPSFEPLQCFGIFALRERSLVGDVASKLERVAMFCSVDASALRSKYQHFLTKAVSYYRSQASCSSFDAWRHVMLQEARAKGRSMESLAPELFRAVAQLGAFTGCTTSCVEVTHSVQDWLWPKRRNKHLSLQCEVNEITIATSPPGQAADAKTIAVARDVWRTVYGRPRAIQRAARQDKGKERSKGKRSKTLGGFFKRARAAVTHHARHHKIRSIQQVGYDAAPGAAAVWSEKMNNELDFLAETLGDTAVSLTVSQAEKQEDAFHACILGGQLKQPDFTPGQAEEAKKRKARALTLQQERAEQAEKRRNTCSFTAVRLCAGQKCYFQPGISDNLGREAVNMKRVRLTRRWIEADWFVLERIGDMATQNLAWAACLLGGFLVDATYMQDAVAGNPSGEPRGVCVAFKAALGTKRRVWCSARFQQLDVYQTMAACVGQAGSQWKFVDLEDFCRERGKRNASLKAIAFVTDDEQESFVQELGSNCVFTRETFITKLARMDVKHTTLGVCGL